ETQLCVHAVQDSKLAHTALQSRFSGATQPISDILFEGTEVGLDAQDTQLRNFSGLASLSKTPASVWTARQDLWGFSDPESTAIAKVTILPANLARMIELFERIANASQLRWRVLVYATGIGWLRLEGAVEPLHRALSVLRRELEGQGGSLVVLHRPEKMHEFDAWGSAGDSLPLQRAVKQRLDPKSTLNPGRFVGGNLMADSIADTARASAFDPFHPPSTEIIDKCVHCGFCLPVCPTYVMWGEGMDSPRGRIYLMKLAGDGVAEMNSKCVSHFDSCLGCMACMTACPYGVDYGQLIEAARS